MIVMGVDPGSRVTGYGIVKILGNHPTCLDFGAIRLARKGRLPEIPERLAKIFRTLSELLEEHRPDVVAVESLFYAANVKSALTLGHVRGVVLVTAANLEIPLVEYSPLEVKKAVVGYGRADKAQVQMMVKNLLNLKETPEPHDAADALAIALCQGFMGNGAKRRQRRWRAAEIKR